MKYAKALVAGLVAAAAFTAPIIDDGLRLSEVLGIVVAFAAGAGLTWRVPNKAP